MIETESVGPVTTETLTIKPCMAVAAHGPVLLMSWRRGIQPDDLDESVRIGEDVWKRHGRYAVINMIGTDLELPSTAMRQRMRDTVRMTGERDYLNVIVLEGRGLWASAIRAAMTGLTILSGRKRKDRIVESSDEAAVITEAFIDDPRIVGRELLDGLNALRSHHLAHR